MRSSVVIFSFLAVLMGTNEAEAARRVAVLVAHPLGGDGFAALRYTGNDLERMQEVLSALGGFRDEDILTSFSGDADSVIELFHEAKSKLAGDPDGVFVFYYSGHAKDGELRLGETRLPLNDVHELIDETGAGLRVGLLDSCRSGAITRIKGATVSAPVRVEVEEPTRQHGLVLITASSEREDAQESDAIQGSFFTHYMTSGLRGAADRNYDGSVTLSEAYDHAYAYTVSRTVGTRGGVQHPTYRFDLRGAGSVVLTRPSSRQSALLFPSDSEGRFVVFDLERRVVVAELDKEAGEEMRLAVVPGNYAIKKRERDHLRMAKLTVRSKGWARVDTKRMERVAFADDYAKGDVISRREALDGPTEFRLSFGLSGQTFLSAPVRAQYLPSLTLLSLGADFDNAIRRNIGVGFDVGIGQSGEQNLVASDPLLGDVAYDSRVSQLSLGASLTARYRIFSWLSAHGQFRLGFILLSREFVDGSSAPQAMSTLTPGLGAQLRAQLTDSWSLGLRLRGHYMFFKFDDTTSLAFIDGGLTTSLSF